MMVSPAACSHKPRPVRDNDVAILVRSDLLCACR